MVLRERKLNRWNNWDYSGVGWYFVTIGAREKGNILGNITVGCRHACTVQVKLNRMGEIVDECWKEIPNHFKNVELDEYIVMPDHVHGIIVVGNRHVENVVGNRHACSVRVWGNDACFVRRNVQLLPTIIGSFKSASSKMIHWTGRNEFEWHKSYHDRIIRNEKELENVRRYIKNNPMNWGK
ncbi:hypothetical protein A2574_04025 [Candidatus Shapirobacteria bacterium RIFOXYD1_FULL_38_32]|uniref:Transposase IS200-like domain-containing protein n=1 Tax=Candidatus Shapirobacteria bacterium GW2011_GWE2_38_30 TaxID=1618490 RepID=A0A0G0MWB1_9BACT|nr:MAG: hypothetical protein US90_C0018G0050 [Candidatus Shapirobacteria bacterium GW2011_GWE2_38_30]OGL55668.1 MAG: hypothetical protein A2195_00410 [Candidatus Shapirobacteria bacterium RIFOXYA1_FULL_39_17]OGL56485.1 MAG: hypothetical protein A2410_03020 [Candidatus Shapirobacteria bacterium RIFOXYC1_FULL_38_24]OGL58364.1 MAG: hypothetical protein A2574_04025 [Candidatus Shapirobacteria bacterium RIFOXYD1_FULL_38_32]HAP37414.1 hypothetical protein [Candidatus Shapirobacteria bacterium]